MKLLWCLLLLLSDKPVPQQTPMVQPGVIAMEKASALKKGLLEDLERLGDRLPPNTLDQLIDELGGPDTVAEVHYYYILQRQLHTLLINVTTTAHAITTTTTTVSQKNTSPTFLTVT